MLSLECGGGLAGAYPPSVCQLLIITVHTLVGSPTNSQPIFRTDLPPLYKKTPVPEQHEVLFPEILELWNLTGAEGAEATTSSSSHAVVVTVEVWVLLRGPSPGGGRGGGRW